MMLDIPDEIIIEPVVKRCVNRMGQVDEQERVAVGGRMRDHLGANICAAAGPVLDDELLAEAFR